MFKEILIGACSAALLYGQADQIGRQDKKPAAPSLSMTGTVAPDAAAVERGKKIFEPACGFCHGLDARGKSGPDLLRSTLVLHDENGSQLTAVIHAGRPERGMPAFSGMTAEQISDISAFLHAGTLAISNRFGYEIKGLLTGSPKQGEAYFNGEGKCASCHSPTGNLAHVASKYEPVELQRRLLLPTPNMMDVFMGKKVKPPPPSKVKFTNASGQLHAGILVHVDEFTVVMNENGATKSYDRTPECKVEIDNPIAAHEALLPRISDEQMHNTLAYLETLK
jgi:mono/diheme cytochrome c family protein